MNPTLGSPFKLRHGHMKTKLFIGDMVPSHTCPVMILTLAWALAITTEELHTAAFLVDLLGNSLNPYFLPPIIFVLSALISFSTGSSWSTMAILYPIAIPLTWFVAKQAGWAPADAQGLLYNVISIVLAVVGTSQVEVGDGKAKG